MITITKRDYYQKKLKLTHTIIHIGLVSLIIILLFSRLSFALSDEEYHSLLGHAHEKKVARKYSESLKLYSQALEHKNNDIDVLRSLGQIYWELNDLEKAILYYEKVISIDHQDSSSLQCLGALWGQKAMRVEEDAEQNKYAWNTALYYYDKAFILSSSNPDVLLGKAYSHYWLGELEKAVNYFTLVVELNRENKFLTPEQILNINAAINVYWASHDEKFNEADVTMLRSLSSMILHFNPSVYSICDLFINQQNYERQFISNIFNDNRQSHVQLFSSIVSNGRDAFYIVHRNNKNPWHAFSNAAVNYVQLFEECYRSIESRICSKREIFFLNSDQFLINDLLIKIQQRWIVYLTFFAIRDLIFCVCLLIIIIGIVKFDNTFILRKKDKND